MNAVFHLARTDYGNRYAAASRLGSWLTEPPCPKCKTPRCTRIPPLVIEWEEGSDVIADFTFPAGLQDIVIAERVRHFLEDNNLTGIEFGEVSMIQDRRLKRPAKPRKKRIWLPYEGPQLWELRVTSASCHLDLKKSKWMLLSECPFCHHREFDVDESVPLDKSLFVDGRTWDGSDFFRIHELDLVLATGKAAELLRKAAFTNLTIERRGVIQ